jgi:hypothetical protein
MMLHLINKEHLVRDVHNHLWPSAQQYSESHQQESSKRNIDKKFTHGHAPSLSVHVKTQVSFKKERKMQTPAVVGYFPQWVRVA